MQTCRTPKLNWMRLCFCWYRSLTVLISKSRPQILTDFVHCVFTDLTSQRSCEALVAIALRWATRWTTAFVPTAGSPASSTHCSGRCPPSWPPRPSLPGPSCWSTTNTRWTIVRSGMQIYGNQTAATDDNDINLCDILYTWINILLM